MRNYNESGIVIDTAGKEEHLIDQLINSVTLWVAYLLCQVLSGLWDTQRLNDALWTHGRNKISARSRLALWAVRRDSVCAG